jgi:hypothetical protein
MGLKFENIFARLKKEDSLSVSFPVIRSLFFIHEGFNEIAIIFDDATTVQAVPERSFPVPFLLIPVELHEPRLDGWDLLRGIAPGRGVLNFIRSSVYYRMRSFLNNIFIFNNSSPACTDPGQLRYV